MVKIFSTVSVEIIVPWTVAVVNVVEQTIVFILQIFELVVVVL